MKATPVAPGGLRWLVLLAVLGVAAWVFVVAWADFRADLGSARARRDVALWLNGGPGQPDPTTWEIARGDLQRAVERQEANPTLHDNLGDLYMVAVAQPWATPALRDDYLGLAAKHYQQTLALRPRDARTWAALSVAYAMRKQHGTALNTAWESARQHGPNESYVMRQLLMVVLMAWDDASPPMRQWAQDLFENGNAAQRTAINRYAQGYGLAFSSDQAAKP